MFLKRIGVTLVTLAIASSMLLPATAASKDTNGVTKKSETATFRDTSFDIALTARDTVALKDAVLLENVMDRKGTFVVIEEAGQAEWKFNATTAGNYTIRVTYACKTGGNSAVMGSFSVNHQTPDALKGLSFERRWVDVLDEKGAFSTDIYGNQLTPQQKEISAFAPAHLYAAAGFSNTPVSVDLVNGENTLAISIESGSLILEKIELQYAYATPSYAEVSAQYPSDVETDTIMLDYEAEKPLYKSSAALIGKSDRSSASVNPHDPMKQRINVVGGSTWNTLGSSIAWEINVPKTGFYAITLKSRKNLLQGYVSYRRLYIDDAVPFDECNSLPFYYDTDWQNITLGNKDGAYLFYLTKGSHALKLEACIGQIAPILQDASDALMRLNALYLQLLVVIGSSPDLHRDYNLTEKIPQLIEELKKESDLLRTIYDRLLANSNEKGTAFVALDMLIDILNKMTQKPEQIPRHYAQFKANLGAMATWMSNARQSPLQLDTLYIHTADEEMPKAKAGFFESLSYSIKNILASFVVDYNTIGNLSESESDEGHIVVWMGGGRDQFQVMKNLLAEGELQKQGLSVDLKLVNTGILLKSIVAGIAPDVMLTDTSSEIINYALRGAVADLNQFKDLPDVLQRFSKEAVVPFTLNEKLYALPTTMSFNVLYYRKDILEDIGVEIPQTWDDVTRSISVLTKSNLEFGLPSGNNTFFEFLMQSGGSVYNQDGSKVAFDGKAGIQAFQRWTGYFYDYGQSYTYDFLNRFRTGEMPIGIADYAFCASLAVSAPEIAGLWDFTQLPGTPKTDGTIDRTSTLGMQGCLILEQSEKKDVSWEFIKWWTSMKTQRDYGNGVERVLGPSGRYTTANKEAMNALPWTAAQKQVLNTQLDSSRAVPEVPGGYIMTRGLNYAFRGVVVEGKPSRDTLLSYVETINNELTSKRLEFGLPVAEGEDH